MSLYSVLPNALGKYSARYYFQIKKIQREYQVMGKQIDENFVKTYSDEKYQHTAMVNHRGTVISFAMDDKRGIYYAVLDIGKEDKKKGSLDVKYWVDNPQLLSFPEEIEQVGYAVVNPVQMPMVKKGTRLEASATSTVSPSEADAFLSDHRTSDCGCALSGVFG